MNKEEIYIPLDFNPDEFKIRRTNVAYGTLFLQHLHGVLFQFLVNGGKQVFYLPLKY